jgi:hypothetical protein
MKKVIKKLYIQKKRYFFYKNIRSYNQLRLEVSSSTLKKSLQKYFLSSSTQKAAKIVGLDLLKYLIEKNIFNVLILKYKYHYIGRKKIIFDTLQAIKLFII